MRHTEGSIAVSVIIPIRNGAHTIARQLDSLQTQIASCSWELIVVDNGSTDGSASVVTAHPIAEQIATRVVHAPTQGVNSARNVGVAVAVGDIILSCDCDDITAAGWIDAYWQRLRASPPHVAAGPLDISVLNSSALQAWGLALSSPVVTHTGAKAGWGSNMAFHRDVWTTLGGFDESFAYGGDDLEFFVRASVAAIPFVWVDDAVVHYRLSPKPTALLRKVYRHGRAEVHLADLHPTDVEQPNFAAVGLTTLKMSVRAAQSLLTRRRTTKQLIRDIVYQAGMMRSLLSRFFTHRT